MVMAPRSSPALSGVGATSPFAKRAAISPALQSDRLAALLDKDEDEGAERSSSALMTAANLVNNYVGMVLLSMHYAFSQGGWISFATLAALTAFGAWTGDLIIESYKTIAKEGVSVPSYAQIGERCMGRFGKWLVIWSSVIETFFAILCMLIIIWSNAALLLPGVPLEYVIACCVLLSLPQTGCETSQCSPSSRPLASLACFLSLRL